MKIQTYTHSEECVLKFQRLIARIYPPSSQRDAYILNAGRMLDKKNPFFKNVLIQNFIIFDNNTPQAHLSAVLDSRLEDVGFFGFFEAANASAACKILEAGKEWIASRNVKEVRAPVSLSVWHDYRFMNPVSQKDVFPGEPINLQEYNEYFQSFGFFPEENFISGVRDDFSDILKYSKKYFDFFEKERAFSIRPFRKDSLIDELKMYHALALEIFKGSWSYVPLSFDEFLYIYSGKETLASEKYCYFLCFQGREIGFCFSYLNPFAKEKTLVMKTIGILPQFQKLGCGATMIFHVHSLAEKFGVKKIIYALMREGNVASNIHPQGARVFRKYQAYSLKLA